MLKLIVLLVAALVAQQPATPATGTAEVSGRVLSRSGDAITGVSVTLQGASDARREVTGRDGAYRFSGVPSGSYGVTFELSGFHTFSRPRLSLTSGQTAVLSVALEWDSAASPDRPVSAAPPISNGSPASPRTSPAIADCITGQLADGEVPVVVATTVGKFCIAIDTKRAPITATNFLKYVDAGLYDGGRFHRATRADNYTPSLPNRPMMNIIQGGINQDKRSQGFAAIPLERTSVTGIKHVTGVVSMARGTGADTATSDFFVLLDDQPSLDFGGLRFDDGQGGAAFGHVLSGLDVVRKIQQQPVDGQNLVAPVTIFRVWRLGSSK